MFPELDLSVEEGLKVLASADMRVHKKDGDKYTKAEIYYLVYNYNQVVGY